MADSDESASSEDSGIETYDGAGQGNLRYNHRFMNYRAEIVVCRNCRFDLCHWATVIWSDGMLACFPISALTMFFDAVNTQWRCRRCRVPLSTGANPQSISTVMRNGRCILSNNDFIVVFASFNIGH